MARGPLTFRQRDVVAAIKAVEASGHQVVRVEIDRTGRIVVVTTRGAAQAPQPNEWDAILEGAPDVRA